jgi:hypothetical protein
MGRKRMSKLMQDGKEWQAFFKVSKDDFKREGKLPKQDSHSLASSLKHRSSATATSAKSPKPQDQGDGVELLWGRIELERDECLKGCLSLVAGRVMLTRIRVWTLKE